MQTLSISVFVIPEGPDIRWSVAVLPSSGYSHNPNIITAKYVRILSADIARRHNGGRLRRVCFHNAMGSWRRVLKLELSIITLLICRLENARSATRSGKSLPSRFRALIRNDKARKVAEDELLSLLFDKGFLCYL